MISLALNLDIGELHCTVKHLAASFENVGEIIEKYIRLSLDVVTLVEIRGLLQILWVRLFRLIRAHENEDFDYEGTKELIDMIRRTRAELHNLAYEVLGQIQGEALNAVLVEYLKAIGNLYNAEIHLLDYLITILREEMKSACKDLEEIQPQIQSEK